MMEIGGYRFTTRQLAANIAGAVVLVGALWVVYVLLVAAFGR